MKFAQKAARAWSLARTQLFWSWRFHSFGARSTVGKCRLARHPKSVSIGHHTTVGDDWCLVDLSPSEHAKPKIKIGSYCTILYGFHCNSSCSVDIHDYVLIAPRVFITDADHVVSGQGERTTLSNEFRSGPVVIEHDCWLGVNSVILKGVRIGHHSIVGANSVVTQNVEPFSIVVGVPARMVGQTTKASDSELIKR